MQLILKDTNGEITTSTADSSTIEIQPGQQIFFTGADSSSFQVSSDGTVTVTIIDRETGEPIEIIMPDLQNILEQNDPNNPFSLDSIFGISTTETGDQEITDILSEGGEPGEIIDKLKEALADSDVEQDGVIIDEFGSLMDLTETAAGEEEIQSQYYNPIFKERDNEETNVEADLRETRGGGDSKRAEEDLREIEMEAQSDLYGYNDAKKKDPVSDNGGIPEDLHNEGDIIENEEGGLTNQGKDALDSTLTDEKNEYTLDNQAKKKDTISEQGGEEIVTDLNSENEINGGTDVIIDNTEDEPQDVGETQEEENSSEDETNNGEQSQEEENEFILKTEEDQGINESEEEGEEGDTTPETDEEDEGLDDSNDDSDSDSSSGDSNSDNVGDNNSGVGPGEDGEDSDDSSVSVTITPINPPEIENNFDNLETTNNDTIIIPISASDEEDAFLEYSAKIESNEDGSRGTIEMQGTDIIFTPNPDYVGNVVITSYVTDSDGHFDGQSFDVNVTDYNHAPEVQEENILTIDEDNVISFTKEDLLNNVSDENINDILEVGEVTTNVGMIREEDGVYTIVDVPENFNGTIELGMVATDGSIETQGTALITVLPINDIPTVDFINPTVLEDTSVTVDISSADIDGDVTEVSIFTGPDNGTATINENGELVYTPIENYNGTQEIVIKTTDGTDIVYKTMEITVSPVNDEPEINIAQELNINEDSEGIVTFDITDIDGDNTSFTVEEPTNGTIIVDGTQITYIPNENYSGNDAITINYTDGTVQKSSTLNIDVQEVNDEPWINITNEVHMIEDEVQEILMGAGDIEGAIDITVEADNGVAIVDEDGNIVYSPNANYNGTDTIVINVEDENGAITTKNVNVQIDNDNSDIAYEIRTETITETHTEVVTHTETRDIEVQHTREVEVVDNEANTAAGITYNSEDGKYYTTETQTEVYNEVVTEEKTREVQEEFTNTRIETQQQDFEVEKTREVEVKTEVQTPTKEVQVETIEIQSQEEEFTNTRDVTETFTNTRVETEEFQNTRIIDDPDTIGIRNTDVVDEQKMLDIGYVQNSESQWVKETDEEFTNTRVETEEFQDTRDVIQEFTNTRVETEEFTNTREVEVEFTDTRDITAEAQDDQIIYKTEEYVQDENIYEEQFTNTREVEVEFQDTRIVQEIFTNTRDVQEEFQDTRDITETFTNTRDVEVQKEYTPFESDIDTHLSESSSGITIPVIGMTFGESTTDNTSSSGMINLGHEANDVSVGLINYDESKDNAVIVLYDENNEVIARVNGDDVYVDGKANLGSFDLTNVGTFNSFEVFVDTGDAKRMFGNYSSDFKLDGVIENTPLTYTEIVQEEFQDTRIVQEEFTNTRIVQEEFEDTRDITEEFTNTRVETEEFQDTRTIDGEDIIGTRITDVVDTEAMNAMGYNLVSTNNVIQGTDSQDSSVSGLIGKGGDTITVSDSNNSVYGEAGNDTINAYGNTSNYLDGGDGHDTIIGGWNNDSDVLVGGAGNDVLNGVGANDNDVVLYQGNREDYDLTFPDSGWKSGMIQVQDTRDGSPDGTDFVQQQYTENIQFADGTYDVATGVFQEGVFIVDGFGESSWIKVTQEEFTNTRIETEEFQDTRDITVEFQDTRTVQEEFTNTRDIIVEFQDTRVVQTEVQNDQIIYETEEYVIDDNVYEETFTDTRDIIVEFQDTRVVKEEFQDTRMIQVPVTVMVTEIVLDTEAIQAQDLVLEDGIYYSISSETETYTDTETRDVEVEVEFQDTRTVQETYTEDVTYERERDIEVQVEVEPNMKIEDEYYTTTEQEEYQVQEEVEVTTSHEELIMDLTDSEYDIDFGILVDGSNEHNIDVVNIDDNTLSGVNFEDILTLSDSESIIFEGEDGSKVEFDLGENEVIKSTGTVEKDGETYNSYTYDNSLGQELQMMIDQNIQTDF